MKSLLLLSIVFIAACGSDYVVATFVPTDATIDSEVADAAEIMDMGVTTEMDAAHDSGTVLDAAKDAGKDASSCHHHHHCQ